MDWVQTAVETLSGNSLRQIVHTHFTSVHQTAKLYVHQTAKLVAALLRVARVTAGLAESNGSLPPGSWLTSPAGWLPRTGISSGTLCSVIEYGLFFMVFKLTYWYLRSFVNGWITTSEERRAAHHTISTKPKTGPRCPKCSRVCASDFGFRSHMRSHDKTGNT